MSELWGWSACETAAAVAAGTVSAREVAQAALDRIVEVNPQLNALSEVTDKTALAAANAVDAARARREALGPLGGVPVTIKNNVDQAGARNTGSVPAARDNVAAEDSPVVSNLRRAGAVIIGRTNVPAFSLRWFTDSDLHGATHNPFGAHLSPGGSSGGAGVALAAGMGALAHGNDIGGSIRQPAHVNGVVGLRPTIGRVPSFVPSSGGARALTSQLITSDGPMARRVDDLAPALTAMAAVDIRDPQQVPALPVDIDAPLPARVGLMRGAGPRAPAPVVDAALTRAANALAAAGCAVEEVTLPRFEEACSIWMKLVFQTISAQFLPMIHASGDRAILHNIDTARGFVDLPDAGEVRELWMTRLQIMREWSLQFAETPVIVLPVSLRHGLRAGADQGDAESLRALFDDQSPLLATALMGHPGLALPTGLAADGAPTGVQLAARWWDEGTLFAAGRVIEAACPPITPITP